MTTARPRLAVLVKGYPRLSETFIAQELLALERRGLDLLIVSLRRPTDRQVHALNRAIRATVLYLPEYLHAEPRRVLQALARQAFRPSFGRALRAFWRDLRREPTRNRVRRFGQALVLAAELPPGVGWLHAHYLHTPGSVARYAALLRDLPFSLSAHAKDVWTIPDWEKREKLEAARWLVTCSRMNEAHLRALAPKAEIELVYHGLDPHRFPVPHRRAGPDGSRADAPVTILCIARAVEKKGIDVLLEALSRLPATLHWRFVHVGGGGLVAALQSAADRLSIAERVAWRGAATQEAVLAALREADLFCLAARVAADGDRDGVPNVLLEAMSQELAVVASDVAAIPELVIEGATGRLVPPEDPAALAAAILELSRAPALRLAMGREGRRRVVEWFSFEANVERIAARFGAAGGPRREAA